LGWWEVSEFWKRLYDYAWFVSFATALVTYSVLMKRCGLKAPVGRVS